VVNPGVNRPQLAAVALALATFASACQVTVSHKLPAQSDPVITERDQGGTLFFQEGQQIWVKLKAPSGFKPYSTPSSSDLLVMAAIYMGPGPDSMVGAFGPGTARLTSRAVAECPGQSCDSAAREWHVEVRVFPGSFRRNPWTVQVPGDGGPDSMRLRLRPRDEVDVVLTPDWIEPASSDLSVMAWLSDWHPPNGRWWAAAPFGAKKAGRAKITSQFDPACFHTEPRCQVMQRRFTVEVEVIKWP
jgi:hypothetical protein